MANRRPAEDWHMRPKANVARPARRRVGVGKRTRGFSPLRQRPVWSFLSEGAHSEPTRRRGQASLRKDICTSAQKIAASPRGKDHSRLQTPGIHHPSSSCIKPRRSPAAAAAPPHPLAIHPHPSRRVGRELAIHPHPSRRVGGLPTLPIGAPPLVIQCILEGAPCTSECK